MILLNTKHLIHEWYEGLPELSAVIANIKNPADMPIFSASIETSPPIKLDFSTINLEIAKKFEK